MTVPPGWYPDPLGLPQLRWWDGIGWDESTTNAKAPLSAISFAYPDDDERSDFDASSVQTPAVDVSGGRLSVDGSSLTTHGLSEITSRLTESPALGAPTWDSPPMDTITTETGGAGKLASYTVAAWTLAVVPILHLVAIWLVVVAWDLGNNHPLVAVAWVLPFIFAIGFAIYDRLQLIAFGHSHAINAWWAALTAPAYLYARERRVRKETGHGSPLLLLFGLSCTTFIAGCLITPGLVISAFPSYFDREIEAVIATNAEASTTLVSVECPAAAPVIIGDSFHCVARSIDGQAARVEVSLQRSNGWIAWQVDDWGGLLDSGQS